MSRRAIVRRGSPTWHWRLILLVVAVTVNALLVAGPAGGVRQRAPLAQPALLAAAGAGDPGRVRLIVQKLANDERAVAAVRRLGGVVTGDLPIINAFTAELPAAAVAELATAAGIRWVSLDAPIYDAGGPIKCGNCTDTVRLMDTYVRAISADHVWKGAPPLQGQGVTVAVVDSGIAHHNDLKNKGSGQSDSRVLAYVNFSSDTGASTFDEFGHGTHIAGIIGGNGSRSNGARSGVAPRVNLVSVKVTDDRGAGSTSDVVRGLQWVLTNKDRYNIRVVNISLNSSVAEAYHNSPLDAALEILWFNRIVVVVSAGNNGPESGILFPPANDPFVITVGATDDRGTQQIGDDVLASFSAYGRTESNVAKPDLVAPGTNIVSLLNSRTGDLARAHSSHIVNPYYFRMSGTSMAAAVASGAAALLLQAQPQLTPDQVKYRLTSTARPFGGPEAGAGYLNIAHAVAGKSTGSANTGLPVSRLLQTGANPVIGPNVNWTSVNWTSVNWTSVNWTSVNWTSVNWTSDYWGD